MGTYTARLGLYKPARSDNVSVQDDVNQSKDILDVAVDRICLSTSRPATPYLGMRCYETDTGDLIICTQEAPVVWKVMNRRTVVNSLAERNELVPREGMDVFRADKGWVEEYIDGAWRPRTVPLVANLNDITNPAPGQLVIYTANMTLQYWDGTQWVLSKYLGDGGFARYYASGTQTFPSGGYYLVTYGGEDTTTSLVTTTGWQSFHVQRAGRWRAEAGIRVLAASGGGQRYLRITLNDSSIGNNSDHTASIADRSSLNVASTVRANAGDTFQVLFYQDSGADLTTEVFGQETFFTLTYEGP